MFIFCLCLYYFHPVPTSTHNFAYCLLSQSCPWRLQIPFIFKHHYSTHLLLKAKIFPIMILIPTGDTQQLKCISINPKEEDIWWKEESVNSKDREKIVTCQHSRDRSYNFIKLLIEVFKLKEPFEWNSVLMCVTLDFPCLLSLILPMNPGKHFNLLQCSQQSIPWLIDLHQDWRGPCGSVACSTGNDEALNLCLTGRRDKRLQTG